MNLINGDQFKIIERLKTQGIQSVDAITRWQKKPKTAVRRTLLSLEKRGIVERLLKKTERGRPVLCYKLSAESKAFFPSKEAEVLNELIEYLLKLGHTSILEDFFSKYWDQRYELVMKRLSERKCQDLSTRLEVLKGVLNEDGFYARSSLNKNNDQITLRECHCPIAAVATAINIPCRLEAKLISRVLNADCTSASPMSAQQNSCVFTFKKKRSP
jgi:predicted ArsR family transcriptional regulator